MAHIMGQLFGCCVFHKIGDLRFGGKGEGQENKVKKREDTG